MNQEYQKFNLQDVAEITIGSVLLAFPIAVTEEVWVISEKLPIGRTLLISFLSIMFFMARIPSKGIVNSAITNIIDTVLNLL